MKKLLLPFMLFVFGNVTAQTVAWPHHKKATIVLTYDDALLSQLDTAVPQLKRAGLTATFFLTADLDYNTLPRWRSVAKAGFELGNHTLYHPCLSGVDNPVPSADYTAFQMMREIEVMNWLLFAIDGKTSRTYAYPCAETLAGGKDYVDTLRRYGPVKYARIGGDTGAVITDFAHLDLLRIPSLGLEGNTPASVLIGFVRRVEQTGGMGIIMFHGIGGDYITTSTAAHQELLNYLKKDKDIWVAGFQQAMDYVVQQLSLSHV
jgi:peptidoglycan-N-acetylglucosamine deacetylase